MIIFIQSETWQNNKIKGGIFMKKLLVALLMASMAVFGMTGCGNDAGTQGSGAGSQTGGGSY